jgi:DNA-binding NarL/FixJ family response regulator
VIGAADGDEALVAFRARRAEIRCVLLDMIMPRRGGRDTFLGLRSIDPEVRVIVTTALSLTEEVQGILDLGARAFLKKPYELEALGDAIERISR